MHVNTLAQINILASILLNEARWNHLGYKILIVIWGCNFIGKVLGKETIR